MTKHTTYHLGLRRLPRDVKHWLQQISSSVASGLAQVAGRASNRDQHGQYYSLYSVGWVSSGEANEHSDERACATVAQAARALIRLVLANRPPNVTFIYWRREPELVKVGKIWRASVRLSYAQVHHDHRKEKFTTQALEDTLVQVREHAAPRDLKLVEGGPRLVPRYVSTVRSRRVSFYEYALRLAETVASRGTCARRQVGCVLMNERRHVLATGYNGVPAGARHCDQEPCPGAGLPSGTGLDLCEAVHAEANALLQCHDVWDAAYCFTTTSPCVPCVKLLLNTGVREVVFRTPYAHDEAASRLWVAAGRTWTHWTGEPT